MISEFIREQKRYTRDNLKKIFHCSDTDIVRIIKRLKEYGLLKKVKNTKEQLDMSNLIEQDIEVSSEDETLSNYLYVFTFVGIIIIEGIVLKCYPKYLLDVEKPKKEMKQVIKVIEKYNSKEQVIRMYNDTSERGSFNMLAVLLFLLQDYYEYGSYTNTQDIIEVNGSGEILWDKTINETFTLISNNRPYYPSLLTRKCVNDDFDYFKRLHECILTKCSKSLGPEQADLLELFEIIEVNLSDEEIDDFGENDYILERIQKELNIQFNTRKQRLLKTLYAYIAHSSSLSDIDCFSMFGTNSFNLVWEKVCAEVMDNQLQKPLGAIELPSALSELYDRDNKLIDLIEHPTWYGKKTESEYFDIQASDTLTPDLVSIVNNDGEWAFIIFDAKYYNIQLEDGKKLRDQPGIESITKQYLYQLAYMDFIKKHKFSKIRNCFLMPTSGSKIIDKGYVELKMLRCLEDLNLENIQIRLLPANEMYDHYIKNEKLDISRLGL